MSAPIRAKTGTNTATQDLWQLASTGDTGQLDAVLALGADINASNDAGVTALIRAVCHDEGQMVNALIDHGADLNATRVDGFTPLILAAFFGYTDVVMVLVERGADLSRGTRFCTTAAMWATSQGFHEIAAYLEQAQNPGPELITAPAKLEHQQETPKTDLEIEPVSVEPAVVRTLKDPPEIWDLVHEMPVHFNPGVTFVSRITSSWTNTVLLTIAVLLIASVGAYAFLALRGAGRLNGTAQVREDHDSKPIPVLQENTTETTAAQGSLSSGSAVSNTVLQPTDSQLDRSTPASPALTNSAHQTDQSVKNNATHAAHNARPAAARKESTIVLSDRQSSENKPSLTRRESETVASSERATTQTPSVAESKQNNEKSSIDSGATRKRTINPLSTQLLSPATTNSAPKAKVIQWP